MAVIAAVAAVAALLGVAVSSSSARSRVPGAFTTAWQPGRPASHLAARVGPSRTGGKLKLVSFIEGPQWKRGGQQVPPGLLDCPAVTACYLLAQTASSSVSTVGPYPNYYNSLYFSGDGATPGRHWHCRPGLEFTAALLCPSARACVGVGYQGNRNEFLSTTDGGHQWFVSPLRAPADVMSLSCSSVFACSFITESADMGSGSAQQFASTANGGVTWFLHSFDADLYISSFSCPSRADCLAIASLVGADNGSANAGAGRSLISSNGGHTWSSAPIPSTPNGLLPPGGPGNFSLLSCANTSYCVVFGRSTFVFRLQSPSKLPEVPPKRVRPARNSDLARQRRFHFRWRESLALAHFARP